MEKLIWKYIDNDCTPEEVQQVKYLLDNDPSFVALYQDLIQLESVLKDQSQAVMSPNFKVSLVHNIEKEVVLLPIKTEIIPPQWWIVLAVVAIGLMTIAYIFPNQHSIFPNLKIPVDERMLALATWSMIGFVCLTLLDYLTKNKSYLKRHNYFLS